MKKIRTLFALFHNRVIPEGLAFDKTKRKLFLVSFYFLVFSIFLTIIGQSPAFASRGITQLFQVGWILSLIPLLMLDYKKLLNGFTTIIIFALPFYACLLLSLLCGVNGFNYEICKYIPLCCYIFTIGYTFGKYKNKYSLKAVLLAYIVSSILFAAIVYFTKLRGYDINNEIYAYGGKNSAGPIMMSAAILSFYVFDKNKPLHIILRWGIMIFFLVITALLKNRAVLIISPIIIFILLFWDIKNNKISFIILGSFVLLLILIITIPYLNETILIGILFNHKRTVDEIFSGRLTQIVVNMQALKPVFGNGDCYFDCMPLSLLCTFGIIGFIFLLPFVIFPFFVTFRFKKVAEEKRLGQNVVVLSIMFLIGSLFEGYGFLGTGAKVFILWLLVGLFFKESTLRFKNHKVFSFFTEKNHLIDAIPTNPVMYSIQGLLMMFSVLLCLSTTIVYDIGNFVADKLPRTNIIGNYAGLKELIIKKPIDSMCIGQRITFGVESNPIDAEDKSVSWGTGWIQNPIISVNEVSGEVKAIKGGRALLHINYFRNTNGTYIQYDVYEQSKYSFDKLHISSNRFTKSFEYTADEIINLNTNCTSHIYYDEYYLPNESYLQYVSTNPSIATIENNTIRAHSKGTCDVYAVVTNDNGSFNSANKITVNVSQSVFTPASSISLTLVDNIYQYQPFNIKPIFNDGASDTNYNLEVSGLDYQLDGESIVFERSGQATIKVRSLNDPSISATYNVMVEENAPTKFTCSTKRIMIGEKMDAKQLGLYLEFSNGYKKIVTESDLSYIPRDFTGRAWYDQNGLVGDNSRTTIKAIKKGNIYLTLKSRVDDNVTATFKIVSSAYATEQEYIDLCHDIGIVAVVLSAVVSLAFSIFVEFKKRRWIIHAYLVAFTLTFIALLFVRYGFKIPTIISLVIILLSLLITLLLRTILKKHIPLPLLNTPIESDPVDKDMYKIRNYTIDI